MQPKLKELIFASFSFEKHSPLYVKIMMLNALMFIAIVINTIFFLINILFSHNYSLAAINLLILFPMLYGLYLLRTKNNHILAGYMGTGILFIAFITIIITQHGEKYTFIWTYFFAPFAMITLNAKRGLIIGSLFLLIIFILTYSGIGTWQNGQWDFASYSRFVLSHFVMLYVMYAIFNGYEKANKKIEKMRENEKHQLKLFEKLSLTDPLTGLYNRRFLKEVFPKQLNRAQRDDKHIAFFLLDIDHFKTYNDTYGHQQGDDALLKVTNTIQNIFNNDEAYIFRIGGDEFAGIILAEKEKEIREKIKTLHKEIEALQIGIEQNTDILPLTVSIGVHNILEKSEYDYKKIFNMTDMALYQAKGSGRNRIVFL
jgi:diguanylate cyclase (GGDEF)-like protein